jgi:hypothetical protein
MTEPEKSVLTLSKQRTADPALSHQVLGSFFDKESAISWLVKSLGIDTMI